MIYLSFDSKEGLKKPLDYTDVRLWDSTQALTVAREEYGVRLVKVCCAVCVNGHRSSKCLHYDRPLMMVKERGQRKQVSKKADEDDGNTKQRPHKGNVFVTPILDPEQPVKYIMDEIPICPNSGNKTTRIACMDPRCCPPTAWGTLHIDMTHFKGFKLLHNQIEKVLPDSLGIEVAPYIGGKSDMVSYRRWEDSARGIRRSEDEIEQINKRDVELSCSTNLADAVAFKFKFVAEDHLPSGEVRPLTSSASKMLTVMMSNINDEMIEEMTELVGSPRSTEIKPERKRTSEEDHSRIIKRHKVNGFPPKEASAVKMAPKSSTVENTLRISSSSTSRHSDMPNDVREFLEESLRILPLSRHSGTSQIHSKGEEPSTSSVVGFQTNASSSSSTTHHHKNISSDLPYPRAFQTNVSSEHEKASDKEFQELSPPSTLSGGDSNDQAHCNQSNQIISAYDNDWDLSFISMSQMLGFQSLSVHEDYEPCFLFNLDIDESMTVAEAVEFAQKLREDRALEERRNYLILQMHNKYVSEHGTVGEAEMVDLVRKACVMVSAPFDETTTGEVVRQLNKKFRDQRRMNGSLSLYQTPFDFLYMGVPSMHKNEFLSEKQRASEAVQSKQY